MKKYFVLLLVFAGFMVPAYTQDPLAISIELLVTQKGAQGVDLKATVTDEDTGEPVKGLPFKFNVTSGTTTTQLGEAMTNDAGVALLKNAAMHAEGYQFTFTASFDGNNNYLKNEAAVDIQLVNIKLETGSVDSVNYMYATVTTWNEKGEEVPVNEGEVKLYVPRLFSLLPIGDITTDEDGKGEFKFPMDIPGGYQGELTVIGRIEEDDNFGNAEASFDTTWGVKKAGEPDKLPRALWSPDAPLWMLITFTILMTGVWYHYGLIVYKLVRIRRSNHPDEIDYTE